MESSAISSSSTTSTNTSTSAMSGMSSEDFFELLVTELQSQDPFDPQDTASMIGQVSQIRDLEVSSQLTDTLQTLVSNQKNLGSADLIGKYVLGTIDAGDYGDLSIEGVVTGVAFGSDGEVILELDTGMTLPADNLQYVSTLDAVDAARASANSDDGEDSTDKTTTAKSATTQKPSWFTLDASLQL